MVVEKGAILGIESRKCFPEIAVYAKVQEQGATQTTLVVNEYH